MTRLRARTVAIDPALDPLDLVRDADDFVWASGGRRVVAWGRAARLRVGRGDDRFEIASAWLRDLFSGAEDAGRSGAPWGAGPLAFGSFTFDPDADGSEIVVPEVIVGRDRRRAWRTTVGDGGSERVPVAHVAVDSRRVRRIAGTTSVQRWLDAVAAARAAVDDGILDKVVLARDAVVVADGAFDVADVVRRLAAAYPDCFTFSFGGLVGSTPELLVRRRARAIESLVLGGTAARGATPGDDERAAARLRASPKERREHALAVETVHEGLRRRAVEVRSREPEILRLSYAQHLCTRVTATGRADVSALELAGGLHPTAAVCGAPTDKALAAIGELEEIDRERYCGPVGWVDASGDGEWGIALRCAHVDGPRARLFAGAGIVTGSEPDLELAETELKLRPLLRALGLADA